MDATENQVESGIEGNRSAYGSPWEHLSDELRLFDARVYLATLRRREQDAAAPPDPFRSLAISGEDIARAADRLAGAWDDTPEPECEGDEAAITELLRRLQEKIWDRRIASKIDGVVLPLARISEVFGLDRFEEICLVMCMAAELDRRYERLFGYLQDDLTRNRPSIDLFFDLLRLPVSERVRARRWFGAEGPLIRHRLIRTIAPHGDPAAPLINRFLQIDERIAGFLLGFDEIDARLRAVASFVTAEEAGQAADTPETRELRTYAAHHFRGRRTPAPLAICLWGPDTARKEAAALAISRAAGKRLIAVQARRLRDCATGAEDVAALLGRESRLVNAAILYRDADSETACEHSGEPGTLTFICSAEPVAAAIAGGAQFFSLEMGLPDESSRMQAWQQALAPLNGSAAAVDAVALASQFQFTESQIERAIEQAKAGACRRRPERPELTAADVYAACRGQASPRLGTLARRIVPRHTWPDLVAPDAQSNQLHEICDQARYGQVVYGEWGFARSSTLGKGVNVLFTGSPGTGKTMSAEIIANELGLELYKIDLSQVVSKYVGETEKNLSSVFREAQGSNAILFFDEADALFGKRSEVKDAHDRYANIEIGFLLQRMEEYSGISIMATNLRKNLDDAFVRRLHFIVEFPFPDEANRLAIWQKQVPATAPSESLDLEFLARQFSFAGGSIRNIAVNGAFRAAAEKVPLGMKHLAAATEREFEKMGRTCAASEFGEYARLLKPAGDAGR